MMLRVGAICKNLFQTMPIVWRQLGMSAAADATLANNAAAAVVPVGLPLLLCEVEAVAVHGRDGAENTKPRHATVNILQSIVAVKALALL